MCEYQKVTQLVNRLCSSSHLQTNKHMVHSSVKPQHWMAHNQLCKLQHSSSRNGYCTGTRLVTKTEGTAHQAKYRSIFSILAPAQYICQYDHCSTDENSHKHFRKVNKAYLYDFNNTAQCSGAIYEGDFTVLHKDSYLPTKSPEEMRGKT